MLRFFLPLLFFAALQAAELPFPQEDCLVRGAGLKLRHSVLPQFPDESADALVSGVKKSPLSFTVTMKHGQDDFIGAAVLPAKGFFRFGGFTVLAADVENRSAWPADVLLRVHTGDDPARPFGRPEAGVYLMPGEKRTVRVPLSAFRKDCRVSLAPGEYMHGKPFGMPGFTGVDPDHVSALVFWSMTPYLRRDAERTSFSVSNLRLTDELPKNTAPLDDPGKFFPFVDRYGQYRYAEWPEKAHNDDELRASAKREAAAWKPRPAAWNRYGGYAPGPTLKATGFFRTEKYQDKWYLVDPEGKLFFSSGVNGLAFWEADFIDGREHYYTRPGEVLPDGKTHVIRHAKHANEIRWGTPWPQDVMLKRLDSWGINTVGAWSDWGVAKLRTRPYTVILMSLENDGHFGVRARDPYDPRFAGKIRELLAGQFKEAVGDPMCIGFFVTNELFYGTPSTWAEGAVTSDAAQPAKREFRKFLEARHRSIAAFNKAWGRNDKDFDAFLENKEIPATAAGKRDLEEFSRILLRKFFEVSRNTVKEIAPRQLYLGARFQMSAGGAYGYLAPLFAEYCDVASYNCYWLGLDHFAPEIPDMPVMITEFNVGGSALRGMFYAGLAVGGFTESERGEALKRYLESALRNPRIVGMHYYTWVAQPLCGRRLDGENMSLGLLDVADQPYSELTDILREVAEKAIPYRMENR